MKNEENLDEIINSEDGDAINGLACRYYYGEGVEKDREKALELYKVASEKGSVKGKLNVALSYYRGKDVQKDSKKAFEMFNDIAEKYNHDVAYYYLGEIHYYGEIGKKDYEKAFYYYNEALKINPESEKVKYAIAYSYFYGQGVEKNIEKAFEIFKDLEEKNEYESAYIFLGKCYYYGKGTQKDYEKAMLYFNKSIECEEDIKEAKYYLGVLYMYGQGVEVDILKAKMYFEEVLDENKDNAYYKLALIHTGEFELAKNEEKSNQYFNKIQTDLCIVLIYYAITFDIENLEEILNILNSEVNEIKRLFLKFKETHPAVLYHNRLLHLTTKEYKDIVDKLKSKIDICKGNEKLQNMLNTIDNHEKVIELAKCIVEYDE